jgi:integrase
VEAALHPALVRYLRMITPGPEASGHVHPNPQTGEPYVNIRAQWARLVEIANGILSKHEQLAGVREHFYTWRHTGASELAAKGADPVMIARMMGDTSLKTVMDHYFDSSVEHMQEVLAKWELPIGEEREESDAPSWSTN